MPILRKSRSKSITIGLTEQHIH